MKNHRFRGYTLIELSITMTVGSALLILSVGLIHQAMRYHSVTRDREAEHRTLDRLSSDFRRDTHLATHAKLRSSQELELFSNEQTVVRFRANEREITKENIQDGQLIHKESYELKRPIVGVFSVLSKPTMICLSIQSTNTSVGTKLAPQRQFTAALGRLVKHHTAEVTDDP
jgi:prepilin-type N-terminal cleavage/methylation domain-containing protein